MSALLDVRILDHPYAIVVGAGCLALALFTLGTILWPKGDA